MSDYDMSMHPQELATKLTHGAALACIKMTADWQTARQGWFSPGGAHFLYWQYQDSQGNHIVCEMRPTGKSKKKTGPVYEYRLTEIGLQVKKYLLSFNLI